MLTTQELSAIQEQLKAEQILVEQNKEYAKQCNDPEIKKQCEQMAGKHREHFQALLNLLQEGNKA